MTQQEFENLEVGDYLVQVNDGTLYCVRKVIAPGNLISWQIGNLNKRSLREITEEHQNVTTGNSYWLYRFRAFKRSDLEKEFLQDKRELEIRFELNQKFFDVIETELENKKQKENLL